MPNEIIPPGVPKAPKSKPHEVSDWFTRMDEQLDVLIQLQFEQNGLFRELLEKPIIHVEPGEEVTITTYRGVTIRRVNGSWTVTYEGETFTGTWGAVLGWIDDRVVSAEVELLTEIRNFLAAGERQIDIISLALVIPANTTEGGATSVTEITKVPYEAITGITLHFPDASRLKCKGYISVNGRQILPMPKENDAVNYVTMRNSTMSFPLNYKTSGLLEITFSGWNDDIEDSHQIFALVGCRQKE